MPALVVPENATILEGILLEPAAMQTTPTGLSLATLEVEHRSDMVDVQPLSRYELRMVVLAIGPLAEACRTLPPGSHLRVEGRLNQRRWIRAGKTRWGRTELVARHIESKPPADPEVAGSAGGQSKKEMVYGEE
ncbi:MAG: single-stranded DNA-binding protein [Magnetococcales bacterium]|nr:single-stranded DNA-binding protein [Magnetococcales bacterium]